MTRPALVSPAQRDRLRQLKTEFDAACAAVEDFSDKSSPSFQTAQDLYRSWIKAIDLAALPLLDDLDALDANVASSFTAPPRSESPVEAVRPADVEHVFVEIDDGLHARAIVGADDEDDIDLFGR